MRPRTLHRIAGSAREAALADLDGSADRGVAEQIVGPGNTAPYPSRWSDGSFGVLYAAFEYETSIAEHGYHLARVLREFRARKGFHPRSHLVFDVSSRLDDVRREDPRLSDPIDYSFARARGRSLHRSGSNGVIYWSTRRSGGTCVGIFRRSVIEHPAVVARLGYAWDGERLEAFEEPISPLVF